VVIISNTGTLINTNKQKRALFVAGIILKKSKYEDIIPIA